VSVPACLPAFGMPGSMGGGREQSCKRSCTLANPCSRSGDGCVAWVPGTCPPSKTAAHPGVLPPGVNHQTSKPHARFKCVITAGMDVQGCTDRLHKLVLAWDYDSLWHRADEGKGVYDNLCKVPNTFDSIEVGAAFWLLRFGCRMGLHALAGAASRRSPTWGLWSRSQHYKRVFEPLVLEEFGAQVLRGAEEGEMMVPHPAVQSAHRQASGHSATVCWWPLLHLRLARTVATQRGMLAHSSWHTPAAMRRQYSRRPEQSRGVSCCSLATSCTCASAWGPTLPPSSQTTTWC